MTATAPATNAVMHGGVASPARRLRTPALAVLGLVAVAATACASTSAGEQPVQKPQQQGIALLFAPTADGRTMEPVEGTSRFELTLNGVTPQVVWFSDRPARQSGHVPIAEFVESWEGYGFVEDPPNAALAVVGADDSQDTVVVELGSPEFDEAKNTIRFPAEVLDEATGNLSHLASDVDPSVEGSFGPASLFIDDATGKVINGYAIQPDTNCAWVNMPGADLNRADLFRAKLNSANLKGADLGGANLEEANLSKSDLSDAHLLGANLHGANLNRAYLDRAIFIGANLTQAKLIGANLNRAILGTADLSGANLSGANFSGANVSEANFSGADLSNADLSEVKPWDDALVSNVRFCRTKLPDGSVANPECKTAASGVSSPSG